MLTTFLLAGGPVLVLALPLFYVAWRSKRITTMRNFLIGAGSVALLCSILAGVSDRQVQQCRDAGNSDCVDAGTAGMQALMIAIYVIASWMAAASIYRDS